MSENRALSVVYDGVLEPLVLDPALWFHYRLNSKVGRDKKDIMQGSLMTIVMTKIVSISSHKGGKTQREIWQNRKNEHYTCFLLSNSSSYNVVVKPLSSSLLLWKFPSRNEVQRSSLPLNYHCLAVHLQSA